jgi:hypothetical protein
MLKEMKDKLAKRGKTSGKTELAREVRTGGSEEKEEDSKTESLNRMVASILRIYSVLKFFVNVRVITLRRY